MIAYVGFGFAPMEGWEQWVNVQAPANYKNEKAIADYKARRLAELAAGKAATDPITGSIKEIVALGDPDGSPEFETRFFQRGRDFCAWVEEQSRPVLLGYRIHKAARLLAHDVITARGRLPRGLCWLIDMHPHIRYNSITPAGGFVDPVSALFGSSDVELDSVGAKLDIPPPDPTDAQSMALFSQRLGRLIEIL